MPVPKSVLEPASKFCELTECAVEFWPRPTETPSEWKRHRFHTKDCAARAPRRTHVTEPDTKVCECGCGRTIVRVHRLTNHKNWEARRYFDRSCVARARTGVPLPRRAVPKPKRIKAKPRPADTLPVVAQPAGRPWRPAAYGWHPDGPQIPRTLPALRSA